jgi:hypothetical protein
VREHATNRRVLQSAAWRTSTRCGTRPLPCAARQDNQPRGRPGREGTSTSSRRRDRKGRMTSERATALRATKAYAKRVRKWLWRFDGWPRERRAWARRDRIEALVAEIETAIVPTPQPQGAARLIRLVTELDEWVRRERAFIRQYPIEPPSHWTRRELSPAARRNIRRAWGLLRRGSRRSSVEC